jgi:hypothetical protein
MEDFMKNRNWFWGVFFIAVAAIIVINQLGYFVDVGLFSLLVTLLLVPIMVKSIFALNFAGILFPAAFLCMIYAEPLGITELTPWTLLVVALLGSIGFSLLFQKKNKLFFGVFPNGRSKVKSSKETGGIFDENIVFFGASFGHSSKRINSKNLQKAEICTKFGGLEAYFDDAKLSSDGAEINFDVSFGGAEIYVPESWNLVNNINTSFGSVEERKKKRGEVATSPTVFLTGNVSFGCVEITYV